MLDQSLATEENLVTQAKNGDRSAFGELVTRYYPSVIMVIYRMCGDRQMAQDAAQEAFIRGWVKLPGFLPHSSFRNWVYRIAVNATLDMLRRRTEVSIESFAETQMIADQSPSPEAVYIQKEQAELLQQAIRSLPEAARSVLILREYGALSYEEIAAVLEIPLGTVMSRLNYARNSLKSLMKNYKLKMERDYA